MKTEQPPQPLLFNQLLADILVEILKQAGPRGAVRTMATCKDL
jgi:hypothetical protein